MILLTSLLVTSRTGLVATGPDAHNKKWGPLHVVRAVPAKFTNKIMQTTLDPKI